MVTRMLSGSPTEPESTGDDSVRVPQSKGASCFSPDEGAARGQQHWVPGPPGARSAPCPLQCLRRGSVIPGRKLREDFVSLSLAWCPRGLVSERHVCWTPPPCPVLPSSRRASSESLQAGGSAGLLWQ